MNAPRSIESSEAAAPSSRPTAKHNEEISPLTAQLRKRLPAGAHAFLLEVDFQSAPGFTILFGASGAGKTTMLDCIAGITTPETGRIVLGDRILFDAAQRINLPVAKRRVGYVFQHLALFPHFTVEKNIQYGLADLPQAERTARSSAILQAFRIPH